MGTHDPASKPTRRPPTFGAEPWRQEAGRTWSWWDLWCCVVAERDHDGDLEALAGVFADRLRRVGNLHHRDGNEAKLSHIRDLTARLTAAGLETKDLATPEQMGDTKVTRRASQKVIEMSAIDHRAKTAAMCDTPTRRLSRRARRGHWEAFPSDPARFYEKFAPTVERKGFVTENQSFGVARRLRKRLGELDGPRRTLADRLALYRGFHTAGLEIADAADDSCGVIGETRREAWETYVRIDWRGAGMEPEAYWQDLCELAIWEPYGLDHQAEGLWFVSARAGEVEMIETILLGLEAEHRAAVVDYQADEALERLADLYVATGALERCRGAAKRLGSRAWRPIVTMATALIEAGDRDGAIEVFQAADQPGIHQGYLRDRCRQMTDVQLG